MTKTMQEYLDASTIVLAQIMQGEGDEGVFDAAKIRDAVARERPDWTEQEQKDLILLVSRIAMWIEESLKATQRAVSGALGTETREE